MQAIFLQKLPHQNFHMYVYIYYWNFFKNQASVWNISWFLSSFLIQVLNAIYL